MAGALLEKVLVEGDQLRDVGYGILRESRQGTGDQDVPGGIKESHVRGEHDTDDRAKTTAIEGIGLEDEERAPKSRFRTTRLGKIGPPDFSAADYQASAPMLFAWALRISDASSVDVPA